MFQTTKQYLIISLLFVCWVTYDHLGSIFLCVGQFLIDEIMGSLSLLVSLKASKDTYISYAKKMTPLLLSYPRIIAEISQLYNIIYNIYTYVYINKVKTTAQSLPHFSDPRQRLPLHLGSLTGPSFCWGILFRSVFEPKSSNSCNMKETWILHFFRLVSKTILDPHGFAQSEAH